ncbi:MAG TPA: hypothetical protein VF251_10440 [Pyrinomonadaceae bacterium]|jgi:hypothetical protein
MKPIGAIVAVLGALLFGWHLAKVLLGTDYGRPPFTHHWTSLIGGIVMFIGIWIFTIGRRRARRTAGERID